MTTLCDHAWLVWLRRIVSCFFFTLAILFAVLWVRSYQYADFLASCVRVNKTTTNGTMIASNAFGTVHLRLSASRLGYDYLKLRHDEITASPSNSYYSGFDWQVRNGPNGTSYRILSPHWFLVLLLSLLAIAIRPAPRFRFSLRDLFTLTTVAALTVGPLAFWLRSIG